MDAATLRRVSLLVDRYSTASERLRVNAVRAVLRLWARFDGWYDPRLVAELAALSAASSGTAQQVSGGLASQYVAQVLALMLGVPPQLPVTGLPPIRGGTDLAEVFERPAADYRRMVAEGRPEVARDAFERRLSQLMGDDVMLAERESWRQELQRQGVTRFRRVVRPELSAEGSCGLCVAASDQMYRTAFLMPIHGSCKCRVLPVIGDDDPGQVLNGDDLRQLYAAAGSTAARDLRRTRVRVREHGEMGPVLTNAKHRHRGPSDVPE